MENDGMVRHLRHIESKLRESTRSTRPYEEQLQQAIADEDYERRRSAARRVR